MTDFKSLFTKHCAMSYDKQLQLADALGDAGNWELDLPTGKLSFAGGTTLNVELLGTEALPEATWLWSWTNATDVLPANIMQAALEVRAFGEANGISEFTDGMLNVDDRLNGHHLAMMAMMLTEAQGYYRAPFDGGALFLLITGKQLPTSEQAPIQRIAHVFPQMIQSIRIENHKEAFIHYLEAYSLQIKESGTAVFGLYEDDETRIHAEFDDKQRLAKLTTVMK
jgi:hypothetical protein